MDQYEQIAERIIVNKIRSSWLEITKMYNEMAANKGGTMSMAFVLLTINEQYGTPVTKIAPRMGMEPNSLSRLLKTMEKKVLFIKEKTRWTKKSIHLSYRLWFKLRKLLLLDYLDLKSLLLKR